MAMSTRIREGLSLEYDAEGVYRTEHDMTSDGLCLTITEALAEIEGVDPAELIDGFSKYADPDALNRLFRVRPNGEHRDLEGHVELEIRGADVTVHADGEIEIEV